MEDIDALRSPAEAGNSEAMLSLASALFDAQRFEEAIVWAKKAIKQGNLVAQTQLGVWHAVCQIDGFDPQTGFELMLGAAKNHELKAQRLIANMYASGLGCRPDWKRAISWLVRAAKAGEATAILQVALLLRPLPRLCPLRHALYYSASAAGIHTAGHLLGLDLLESEDPARKAEGIGWIMAAADEGNAAALMKVEDFIGQKMRRPVPPAPLKRVPWQDLGRYILLPHKEDTPSPQQLLDTPNVSARKAFLKDAVTDYIVGVAAPLLKPATVHDSEQGEIVDDTRTNSFVNFRLLETDIVIQSVNERVMNALHHPVQDGDPLSLLHYRPGQQYTAHYDFFDPDFPAHTHHLDEGGQRVKTGLLYLNSSYSGGVTRFHEADFEFKGEKGDFLAFKNVDADGNPDRMTLHSGEPPTGGEKWLLSKWARAKASPAG